MKKLILNIWCSVFTIPAFALWALTDWPTGGRLVGRVGDFPFWKTGRGIWRLYFVLLAWYMGRFGKSEKIRNWFFRGCCLGAMIIVNDDGAPDRVETTMAADKFVYHEIGHALDFLRFGPLIVFIWLGHLIWTLVRGGEGLRENIFEVRARRNEVEKRSTI